jgi:hypothetical protein
MMSLCCNSDVAGTFEIARHGLPTQVATKAGPLSTIYLSIHPSIHPSIYRWPWQGTVIDISSGLRTNLGLIWMAFASLLDGCYDRNKSARLVRDLMAHGVIVLL